MRNNLIYTSKIYKKFLLNFYYKTIFKKKKFFKKFYKIIIKFYKCF